MNPDLRLFFRENLLRWAAQNPRPMPWKGERDPYKIWLSEIILQQTRVAQGLPYYQKFIAQYPSVQHLAAAPEDELLKLWEGLGYYTRARNLHAAARQVAGPLEGKFPDTYAGIRALKGVGDYTAAAIASFAFGLPHAVLDGNVYRVLARFFGIETPLGSPQAQKQFAALAQELLDPAQPAAHNQAMMDFGALCCTPQQPRCAHCPLRPECRAAQSGRVLVLPVKQKSLEKKKRMFHYLVINHRGEVFVRKRKGRDIWRGLWEFPQAMEAQQASPLPRGVLTSISAPLRQLLTHQDVRAVFYEIEFQEELPPEVLAHPLLEDCVRTARSDLKKKFAFPKVIERFLQGNTLTLGL